VSTAGYVKLLLPPRQSRGNSHWGLGLQGSLGTIRLRHRGDTHDDTYSPIGITHTASISTILLLNFAIALFIGV
jgi:hypothetical protein